MGPFYGVKKDAIFLNFICNVITSKIYIIEKRPKYTSNFLRVTFKRKTILCIRALPSHALFEAWLKYGF